MPSTSSKTAAPPAPSRPPKLRTEPDATECVNPGSSRLYDTRIATSATARSAPTIQRASASNRAARGLPFPVVDGRVRTHAPPVAEPATLSIPERVDMVKDYRRAPSADARRQTPETGRFLHARRWTISSAGSRFGDAYHRLGDRKSTRLNSSHTAIS